MSQENQEVSLIPNELAIQKLADTFDEVEKKAILRDLFIVTQIKIISTKEEVVDANGYTKMVTVKKKMDPFRAMAYVMLCRDLGFNPALNLVTMLEDNFYIGLDAHILYAQKTGLCHGIDSVLEEEKEIEYEKKEYTKGSRTPTISKGRGKYYRYKCTVKKMVGDKIEEFTGIGIASPDNVTGGDKATDLKIMQMAEARSMRRALKKSFPPGCSHIEDVYEYPDYDNGKLLEEAKEQPENLAQLARAPIEPAKPIEEIKSEVVAENEEAKKAITEEKTETPVKKTAKENLVAKQEVAKKQVEEDPRFEQMFGHKVGEEPKKEVPNDDLPPAEDQVARIKELCEKLGENPENFIPSTRALARLTISNLIKKMDETDKQVREEAETEEITEEVAREIFGEEEESKQALQEEIADEFGEVPPEEFATEDEEKEHYRKLVGEAKEKFKAAVQKWKEEPTEENQKAKSAAADIVAEYNKIIISRGWATPNANV